jgi:hypothetical protein
MNRLVRLCYRIHELLHFPKVDGRVRFLMQIVQEMSVHLYPFTQTNEHKLCIISRPLFFDWWMKAHRPLKNGITPSLNDDELNNFFSQFQTWWSSLQPSWRTMLHTEPFTKDSPADTDWSDLCCAGPNGINLIILSFAWLSKYFRSGHSQFPSFLAYIDDTTWVFGQIVCWIESRPPVAYSIKHTIASASSPSPKKRSRRT